MTTSAQFDANRLNARSSTGPRTLEGKAASARNHLSHGLSARGFIVLPGQEEEFENHIAGLRAAVKPDGALELDLFDHLAHASWTLRRCRHAEAALHCGGALDPLLEPRCAAQLNAINLFTRRAERSYHRTLKELKALQTERQLRAAAAAGAADIPAPQADTAAVDRHIALCCRAYADNQPQPEAELAPEPAPADPTADDLLAELMQVTPPAP